ncbi:MAG: hypothetical protein LBF83_08960 [Spirochaetaceae bacterium]|jgi:hypothetical protein|nr:hypothetical protein [Spirochaetaceae bacterium]
MNAPGVFHARASGRETLRPPPAKPQAGRRAAGCIILVLSGFLSVNAPANAIEGWITRPEEDFVAPAHVGAVTCVTVDETGRILSAGEDGFLVIWDGAAMAAQERFQLGQCPVEKIAARPGRNEVAVYEDDGIDFHRVSVWNYVEKERRFTLPVTNPVLYCGYTARGNYLVLGFSGGVALFDGETGEQRGEKLGTYPVTLAVSSRTERTLQTYSPSGILDYWDLDSFTLSLSLSVPANLQTPLVFGRYRFLAGQDSGRLFVVDAVSGRTFFETEAIPGSILCRANDEDASFSRVSPVRGEDVQAGSVRREDFTVSSGGAAWRGETFVSMDSGLSAAAVFSAGLSNADADHAKNFLYGSDDGRLALAVEGRDSADFFRFENQRALLDAAIAEDGVMALIDGNDCGAFIPADFAGIEALDSITLFSANSTNRVTAGDRNTFLFWRYGDEAAFTGLDHIFPFVKTGDGAPIFPAPADAEAGAADEYVIADSGLPLRSAALAGGSVLFTDVSGGISVFSLEDSRRVFSYTSPLSLDAIFHGGRGILVARNAEAGRIAAPFLIIDTVSGETLPLAYPALAAFMLYKNRQGSVYCAVLKTSGRDIKTEVIRLNAQNPEASQTIFGYNGEDSDFSFIEYGASSGGGEFVESFASTIGGGNAVIVSNGGAAAGEKREVGRGPEFPKKLLPWNGGFAALGQDGTVSWYDGVSGKLLAMLRLYETEWLLSTAAGTTKRGALTK